ncbi:hypothetical protein ACTPOK_42225 [Streptomyces inhibens]|uniref:hypothetical protein n=1 Tax=Streptomyces inhibens TaxID=2293571 RepID=UPI00402A9176
MAVSQRTLFDGVVHVHYGQLYVESGDDPIAGSLGESFAGQANGLCGAALPGGLYLLTGLHTGHIGLTVELHDHAPDLTDEWQDIVEVSFRPVSPDVLLLQWAGEKAWRLDLDEIDYRVRYCGTGMDEGRSHDTVSADGPQLECHLLQFWPAPAAEDQVVRQTSKVAAYWHSFARELPPPPTPEERAEAERLARLAHERAVDEERRRTEELEWQGRRPSDRLRQVSGNVSGMVRLDRLLVDEVDGAGPETQREIARWAARRAYTLAGLADVDWIAPALDALDAGRPLPPPFDDWDDVWERLFSDPQVPATTVTSMDGARNNMSQQAMAVPALFGAVEDDPLQAVLDALYAAAAAFGSAYPALFTEVRRTFPGIVSPAA